MPTRRPSRLPLLVFLVNILLAAVKVSTGLLGHSYALVADGIESTGDIFTSLATWAGIRWAAKPADDDHPHGHGKIEAVVGLLSAGSLLLASALIAVHAVHEIRTPHHAPAWFTLPVLLAVVVLKEWLSRRVFRHALDFDSVAARADAWHHRSDAVTSAAAAVGIAVALVGGPRFAAADDWATLVACAVIAATGLRTGHQALHELLDGAVDPGVAARLARVAGGVAGVRGTEKCRMRKSGADLFAELHVRVDGSASVREGHRIAHAVKDAVMAEIPRLRDVVVHIEPD